ncbi:AzlD domain-containing protein [Amorphus sp. 3PC139-8]|uniref:AzlD domain-containing protein n=1 Tax=Amorphus sp. 3PC139-8 TaxID=2735676 RepID=UPI00345D0D80
MSGAADMNLAGLGPYLSILIAAAVPTHVWRWLGVLLAGRLTEDSEFFAWIKAVATALVAGLIAQLILFPNGALADVAMEVRVGAALAGLAVYFVTGKRLVLGLLVAEALVIGTWFLF